MYSHFKIIRQLLQIVKYKIKLFHIPLKAGWKVLMNNMFRLNFMLIYFVLMLTPLWINTTDKKEVVKRNLRFESRPNQSIFICNTCLMLSSSTISVLVMQLSLSKYSASEWVMVNFFIKFAYKCHITWFFCTTQWQNLFPDSYLYWCSMAYFIS